ncbi:hypothetical protein O1611_g3121 [Lasiodiplodia mahajangana]|uniref:Uncharacterized protein n=1 Tax=Lasiodiplodia mahajangana TaxID=1108764 RepID=A0ACC2JSM2_9PEZI|nr:hypothetical protein O1611_g3121 [Lasiodiplodia mahajangana]
MRRTLIVFEWRLIVGINAECLRNVNITVCFQAIGTRGVGPGQTISDWDPSPLAWAPNRTSRDHFSHVGITDTRNIPEHAAQADCQSSQTPWTKQTSGSTQVVKRIDYRYLTGTGTTINKNARKYNAVEWGFGESVQLKSGEQYEVQTAVLLRHEVHDKGKFNVTVVAEANVSRPRYTLDKSYRAVGLRPTDGLAAFDPKVLPGSSGDSEDDNIAGRPTARDWRNLDKLDLGLWFLEHWV